MNSPLYRTGRWSALHPWRVIITWTLTVVAAFGIAISAGGTPTNDYDLPGTQAQEGLDLLEAHLPDLSGASANVVVRDPRGQLDSSKVEQIGAELTAVQHVSQVSPPRLSADGDTAMFRLVYDVPVTDEDVYGNVEALEEAVERAGDDGLEIAYGGEVPESAISIGGTGEIVGVIAALVLLVVTFGSLVAAGLPLVVALCGLGLGSAGGMILSSVMDVSAFAPTVATMVGLGVGIDYALLLVNRFVEFRGEGHEIVESAARATATAGRAVVLAGTTVLVSLLGLRLGGLKAFESFGFATAITVTSVVLAALTLVPALCRLAGDRLLGRRASSADVGAPRRVDRWAARVTRRPVTWTLLSTTVLLALAAPALSMRIWPIDPSVDAADSFARQSYDMISEEFGPGAAGSLTFVADRSQVDDSTVDSVHQALTGHPDLANVSSVTASPDGGIAIWSAEARFAPQDEETSDLISELRREVLPEHIVLTGYSPSQADLSQIVTDRIAVVAVFVIGVSVLLLMLMFRSIVVPIKAAVMNLLSIGAAYGLLVAIFQTDTGASLVGLDHATAVSSFVPIVMFAILFGLSMDYEVFLLSRIREDWLRTGDAHGSIVRGLSATAGVISSAAAIMVAVFIGFSFEDAVLVKMMGIGMAAAIVLDATIVRLVLVPASMTLLGRSTWWMPVWLDRLLPTVRGEDADEHDHQPATKELSRSV